MDKDVLRKKYWEGVFGRWEIAPTDESSGGPGSRIDQTVKVRELITELVEKYNIKSVLDLPCNDLNWMSKVDLSGVEYVGMDISPSVILYDKEKYQADAEKRFKCLDPINDEIIDSYDIIISRDFLVHLSFDEIKIVINNFKSSGSKYLLTTTFPNTKKNNSLYGPKEGDDYFCDWQPLNLRISPFNFPKPIAVFEEDIPGKYLGLWSLKNLEVTNE